jgi:hypothetical protein
MFRDCYLRGRMFDLLFFNQCKLHCVDALTPATFETARSWCRSIVSKYKASHEGRNAGFMFGVTNPIQLLTGEVRHMIDSLSSEDDLEFFYAMGRLECKARYSNFFEHPALFPRVYINEEGLPSELLAAALPHGWPQRLQRAAKLIETRPEGGYEGWKQVLGNARLESDDETVELTAPETLEETAVRFC